jgi:hypothetical protein
MSQYFDNQEFDDNPIKTTLVDQTFTLSPRTGARNYYFLNNNYAILRDSWITQSMGEKNITFMTAERDMTTRFD